MELSVIERIILLTLLGQVGMMIFFYWTRKTITLFRKSPKKLAAVFVISGLIYFFNGYFIYKLDLIYVLEHSILWIPMISLTIIDIAIQV